MKTLSMIALFVGTTFGLQAQNVTIPDANFKAYLVGNSAINTNGDAEIQVSEATAFTMFIECMNMGITDLTGVEAFVNVNSIHCANNSLSSLDVSQNVNVDALICDNNSLTTLDLSQNTALTILSCQDNNLTALDVSQNTLLTQLWCKNNALTSLVIGNNPLLTAVNCMANAITTMDLTQNTALNSFACDSNAMTNLNIANGNNTNINWFSTLGNTALMCVEVDDAAWSTSNWTNIEGITSFSEDCATAGITNVHSVKEITVYPNPTSSNITIDGLSNVSMITLIDATGKTIGSYTSNSINLSSMSKGLYFLEVKTGGKVVTKRIIKK